jgi:hypothetical protein
MRSRRHNLPDATTRSRGLSAAGGGSVATIASATVSRSAAHAVMTAMTNLRNIWSSLLAQPGPGNACFVSLAVRGTREASVR